MSVSVISNADIFGYSFGYIRFIHRGANESKATSIFKIGVYNIEL